MAFVFEHESLYYISNAALSSICRRMQDSHDIGCRVPPRNFFHYSNAHDIVSRDLNAVWT